MIAAYVLAALSVVFLMLVIVRVAPGGDISHPQTKTWLVIAVIFAAVSAWLFSQR